MAGRGKSWGGKVTKPKPKSGGASATKKLKSQLEAAQKEAARSQELSDAKLKALESESKVKDMQIAAERSSGSRALVEGAKVAVPAVIGAGAGVAIARAVGRRLDGAQAKKVADFVKVANRIETLQKTKATAVGTRTGDKLAALVNEGYVLGGRKPPLPTGPIRGPVPSRVLKPLFSKGGKVGAAIGLGLVAEGVVSRFVVPHLTDDPNVVAGAGMLGTGSMVAGLSYLTARKIGMAGTSQRPPSVAIAKVTSAHSQLLREAGTLAPKSGIGATAGKIARGAFKFALPAVAVGAGVMAFRSSAQAGESKVSALGQGLKAGSDVMLAGAIKEFEGAKSSGSSTGRAVAQGAFAGALNTVTLGGYSALTDAMKGSSWSFSLGGRSLTIGGEAPKPAPSLKAMVSSASDKERGQKMAVAGAGMMLVGASIMERSRSPVGMAVGASVATLGAAYTSTGSRLAMARGAASRSRAASASPVIGLSRRAVATVRDQRGDGRVASYYRQQDGKNVFVQGYVRQAS